MDDSIDYVNFSVKALPHPDVIWYRLKGMGAQKSSCNTFYIYIHVNTKWNIVYEYLKTKIFSRDTNILLHTHWTSNIFGLSIGGFWVSLNYPIINFKKTVCPKNVWMWHVRGYLPLIRKDSITHTHGLTVCVNEGLPFARDIPPKNSADPYVFD